MATTREGELVCVTGASGHLGTWLVKRLLEKGYRVRATVRNPGDPKKTAILRNLPGAHERLQLVRGQLLEEGGFDDAVYGCDGVFHCATPTDFSFEDPYKDCIEPAVNGTVNVLKACSKAPSIKRIVFTSSAAAARFTQLEAIPDQRFDESCWTDVEMCEREREASWMGDTSHDKFVRRISYVHIDDIIGAHIFLYETPAAQGRYIGPCVDASIAEVAELLKNLFPKIKLPDKQGLVISLT